jgi:hypothetical protein
MCRHNPPCPSPDAPDREAAKVIARGDTQGWCVNCTIVFDDTGELLPDGRIVAPRRPLAVAT